MKDHDTTPMKVVKALLPPRVLTWRFGVLVLLLTLISVALSVRSSINTNQNTKCLADYARRNAEVSQVRADANKAKDDARDQLLDRITKLIVKPGKDPAVAQQKLRQTAQDYRQQKRVLDATRATSPTPGFPKECGRDNDAG